MEQLKQLKKITEQITSVEDISKMNRELQMVRARCIYYIVAREELELSFQKIANYINRDHATALHAIRKFDSYIYQSDLFKENYEKVKKSFRNLKKNNYFLDTGNDELTQKYNKLQSNYEDVIKKQRKDRRKLLTLLKTKDLSERLETITKDLNSKQIDQMFERMEQFAKMCNYHNEKKKVL